MVKFCAFSFAKMAVEGVVEAILPGEGQTREFCLNRFKGSGQGRLGRVPRPQDKLEASEREIFKMNLAFDQLTAEGSLKELFHAVP